MELWSLSPDGPYIYAASYVPLCMVMYTDYYGVLRLHIRGRRCLHTHQLLVTTLSPTKHAVHLISLCCILASMSVNFASKPRSLVIRVISDCHMFAMLTSLSQMDTFHVNGE